MKEELNKWMELEAVRKKEYIEKLTSLIKMEWICDEIYSELDEKIRDNIIDTLPCLEVEELEMWTINSDWFKEAMSLLVTSQLKLLGATSQAEVCYENQKPS